MKINTYASYETTLVTAKESGYKILSLDEYYHSAKHFPRVILLRHDIDFDPFSAVNLSQIEARNNIHATYLIRVRANTYNPAGFKVYSALHAILSKGHQIGLHSENIDSTQLFLALPDEEILKEKTILETVLGIHISIVGGHRALIGADNQSFWKTHNPQDFGFHYHVFDKMFTQDATFVSDAIGAASDHNTEQLSIHQAVKQEIPKIYASIHPCYWHKKNYLLESARSG